MSFLLGKGKTKNCRMDGKDRPPTVLIYVFIALLINEWKQLPEGWN